MSVTTDAVMIKRVTPDQLPTDFNISQSLLDGGIECGFGDNIAFYYQDQTTTYRQLSREVNKLGNLLKNRLGVIPESRVVVLLPDCPEFVSSFLAIIKIGAVAVPLSTMLSPADYVYMLNDTRATALIADASFLNMISSIEQSLEHLKHILIVDDDAAGTAAVGAGKFAALKYRESLQSQSDTLPVHKTNKDDAAFWNYSSGTTGKPKGTIHLQHDIYYAAFHLNQYFYDITDKDTLYSASKLFFAYGLGNSFWMPMFSGASAVLERQRSTPDVVVANINKYKPTKVFAVPTVYNILYNHLTANDHLVSECRNVERYYSAGEPLSKILYDKWLALTGREILTVLGSTEALQGYIGAWPGMGHPGCLGKVIPGYFAKVVDDREQEVKPREKGVLMIKGDSIASSYWNRHKESKKAFRGDWLYTGDVAYESEDGILWYAGRNDEMFKIAGLWVSPLEIEEVLSAHPCIQESAVVAYDGDDGLTTMVAYLVCKENVVVDPDTVNSLQELVKAKLPTSKRPRAMQFIKELPRSSTGKVQKFVLKELYKKELHQAEPRV